MRSPATPYLQVVKGSRDLRFEFWNPSISRVRLELETSNFMCILTTRGTNERSAKLGQTGWRRGHVTSFEI